MENNLSQKHISVCTLCVDKCQECIDACQRLIDMCSIRSYLECGKELGTVEAKCKSVIESCQQQINISKQYLPAENDPQKKVIIQNCIDKSAACIEICKKVITECSNRSEICLDSVLECIKACNICAQSCKICLE